MVFRINDVPLIYSFVGDQKVKLSAEGLDICGNSLLAIFLIPLWEIIITEVKHY
jgi:hypothetical protein